MMILLQCPHASQVAGFHTWKKEFGRTVKKGAKGIQILFPCTYTKREEQENTDPDSEQSGKKTVTGYKVGYVFDVSQTEGREIPSLNCELSGDVEQYEAVRAALEGLSPAPVRFAPLPGESKGSYSHVDRSITVQPGMSQVQTIKTLIHEIAHLVLELIRRDMPFDMVLNVDTGMEFPAMYEHIDKVERFLLSERGIPITRIKAPHTFEHLMLDAVRETKPGMPIGYGWPSIKVRWCTGQLKTQVIDRYLRHLPARPYHYIAFAADEGYRLERPNNQDAYKRYPMMDWGVTEAQALAGCYAAGYTWDGLYEKVSRASC